MPRRNRLVSSMLAVAAVALAAPALAAPGDRSPDGLWVEVDRAALGEVTYPLPQAFHAYRLNFDALSRALGEPPDPETIFIPLPDGTFAPVSVDESPVMGRELAARYPGIKTFAFRGVDDRAIAGRMTLNPSTFQAIMRPPSDLARITPLTTGNGTFYLSFLHRDRTDGADDFRHRHDDPRDPHETLVPDVRRFRPAPAAPAMPASPAFAIQNFQVGGTVREYRLAAAATGEYYQAMAGPNGALDVVSAMVVEINNANAMFEAELSIRLIFTVAILFTDPANDPYSTVAFDEACTTRNENVAAINGVIDPADYDIGFAFNQGTGFGCAWYVLCLDDKAQGAGLFNTSLTPGSSTGLLLHEMGHQLGAHHTFSGLGCKANEFNQTSAYEPGSGSTIASYLGSCGDDNVDVSQVGSGLYYHTRTFDEIISNVTVGSGSTCGSSVAAANTAPVVDAGPDYTIPRGTPFTLTGSAVDAENDPRMFNWEQFDIAADQRAINSDTGEGPLFRSVPPGADPSRTFPRLADILSNTVRKGEFLPAVDRPAMTFRLTARDNHPGGGGVAYDETVLTVAGAPFFITSPNGGESFGAGCPLPVAWSVGGGNVANQVDLGFSDDGGNTVDPLLGPTANDGAANAVAPCANTNQARVKASAVGNVFFDYSNNNFSVAPTPPTVAANAVGGAVDDACQFIVHFNASVVDDCGVAAGDVSVQAFKQGDNYTLGPVAFVAQQTNTQTVSVTGTVLVSDLTSSPAVLDIKVTGADACNASQSDTVQVQVVDDTPPSIQVSAQPNLLWPPNHTLKNVHLDVVAADNCGGVSFVMSSIASSEPDNGLGDGNTVGDIQDASLGTPDTDVVLRAERSGNGPGRIYTIGYTATDGSNNQTQAATIVTVPHNQ
jgi:hypothetical protein